MAVRVQRTREGRGRDESSRLIQCLVITRDFTAMNICFLISVIVEMTARGHDKTSTSGISFLKKPNFLCCFLVRATTTQSQ